jgi:hypothetical protein
MWYVLVESKYFALLALLQLDTVVSVGSAQTSNSGFFLNEVVVKRYHEGLNFFVFK